MNQILLIFTNNNNKTTLEKNIKKGGKPPKFKNSKVRTHLYLPDLKLQSLITFKLITLIK